MTSRVAWGGFGGLVSPALARRSRGRLVNIHPALLPAFPGAHAVRDALRAGVTRTGVTVHFVDEEVDHGPIILQEAVAIRPRETAARLATRIHRVEHRLYPEAIRLVLAGRTRVVGRTVAVTRPGKR